MTRVTVWNEYRHEQTDAKVREVYPEGIHGQLASFLKEAGMDVKTATLDEPEHGLTEEVLNDTDVLIWWGHVAHQEVVITSYSIHYTKLYDGGGVSGWMWDNQIQSFSHYHCIVPELPGHGESHGDILFSIRDSAERFIEFIEEKVAGKPAGCKVILIGFSLGAQVIIQIV